MTAMAMGGKGSGAKGRAEDAELLRQLAAAQAAKPPKKVVASWRRSVRAAVRAKKRGTK